MNNNFDKNGFVKENTEVTLYSFNPEFVQEFTCTVYKDTGLPANSTLTKPLKAKDGFGVVWNGTKWEYIEDYRNQTAYNTQTKEEKEIKELGKLENGLTLLKPKSQHDKWNGTEWVLDEQAQNDAIIKQQETTKKQLLTGAKELIEIQQDTIDFSESDLLDSAEQDYLIALKKYRVALNKVDTNLLDCEFPEKPVK